MQQLDKNLPEIKRRFPDYEIHMLTHEHSVKLVEKYESIQKIYVYPYKESFSRKNKMIDLEQEDFDIVLVPVTNISGAGFLNVLSFSTTIRAKRRIICNLISDMWDVTTGQIQWMKINSFLMSTIAVCLTVLGTVIVWPILMLRLGRLEKKGE